MKPKQFAVLMGVSGAAIAKGCASGRLDKSVSRSPNGRVVDIDPEIGAQEWNGNRTKLAPEKAPRSTSTVAPTSDLTSARTRREQAAAEMAELDLQERAGSLVKMDAIVAEYGAMVSNARNTFLGLPSKMKQFLPHLTIQDLAILDREIREILEELARDPDDAN